MAKKWLWVLPVIVLAFGLLSLPVTAQDGMGEDKKEEPKAEKNEAYEKFLEMNKRYIAKRSVGDKAEYKMAMKSAMGEMNGTMTMEVTKKEGEFIWIKTTTCFNMGGQEMKQEQENKEPDDSKLDPNGKYEFSKGDVEVGGKTYKDCDVVKMTGTTSGPMGDMDVVSTVYMHESVGMVKMESDMGDNGTMTMELTSMTSAGDKKEEKKEEEK